MKKPETDVLPPRSLPTGLLTATVVLLALLLIVNTAQLAISIRSSQIPVATPIVARIALPPRGETPEPHAIYALPEPSEEAAVATHQASCLLTSVSAILPAPGPTATYLSVNVQHYSRFTAYWKRELWDAQVPGELVTIEDFEKDQADYGELSFPYLTGNGFLLTGQSTAQILGDTNLLTTGNLIHFRDSGGGLTFSFPGGAAQAIGFDYKPSETWNLSVGDCSITIPEGRRGFLGIIATEDYPTQFTLFSTEYAQGGLTLDNISYVQAAQQ